MSASIASPMGIDVLGEDEGTVRYWGDSVHCFGGEPIVVRKDPEPVDLMALVARCEAVAKRLDEAESTRLPQTAVRCYPDRIACAGTLTETVDGGAVIDLPPKRNGYVRVAVVKGRVPRDASHAMAERIKESGACDVVIFAEPGDDILFYDMPDRR